MKLNEMKGCISPKVTNANEKIVLYDSVCSKKN